jgi:hypothetical protein
MAKRKDGFLKHCVANAQRENSNTTEMAKFNNVLWFVLRHCQYCEVSRL